MIVEDLHGLQSYDFTALCNSSEAGLYLCHLASKLQFELCQASVRN